MSEKINSIITGTLDIEGGKLAILQKDAVYNHVIDDLARVSVFDEGEDQHLAQWIIWELSQTLGARSSSINDLYKARGRGDTPLDFTVPAINIRGIAYDMARAVFSSAKKLNVGAFICELARSEMGYTDQPPGEFASVVLAAAIKEKWTGPVFIQGDHYQAKSEVPGIPKEGDIEEIKKLIKASVDAGFYNIDIDMSTLVDLQKATEDEQQANNIKYSLELSQLVRSIQPVDYQISVGCEIGHIGGKNSTLADFDAFMKGFNAGMGSSIGISKIAVQTGTSHGGVVKPDGTLAAVDVDFAIHSVISRLAREKYQIGGTVQHGASTLPPEMFNHFPKNQTLEIHLATEFQNMIMDHPEFPAGLKGQIYKWLDNEQQKEKEEGQTDEQFHYKARKKAWGKFIRESWDIEEPRKKAIRDTLSEKLEFLFKELNVIGTNELVAEFIKGNEIRKSPSDFGVSDLKIGNVGSLSD